MSKLQRKKMKSLIDEAQCLVDATADLSDANVHESRNRLQTILENGKHFYEDIRNEVKSADCFVHNNPYRFLGLGILAGFSLVHVLRCAASKKE